MIKEKLGQWLWYGALLSLNARQVATHLNLQQSLISDRCHSLSFPERAAGPGLGSLRRFPALGINLGGFAGLALLLKLQAPEIVGIMITILIVIINKSDNQYY